MMKYSFAVFVLLLACFGTSVNAEEPPKTATAAEADARLHSDGKGWRLDQAKIGDSARPRVLLIGDSILNGYLKLVTKSLDGKAYVDAWVNPYNQSEHLNKLLAEVLDKGPYDVVHFNMGLHGWQKGRIKEGTFETLTAAYVKVIREKLPKAKIIWASSTPVTVKNKPEELEPEINPIIIEHNRMAAKVMDEQKVPINDFYALLAPKLNLARGDQFHWKPEAYEILAKQVTDSVLRELAIKTSSKPSSLKVFADFEGGSVREVKIDESTRSIYFMPGGDPTRGWPCWWYFRIDGISPGETITLHLQSSTATVDKPGSPLKKPLAASWAMPHQAAFSLDNTTWEQTEKGKRANNTIVYTLKPNAESVYVAWGPPYTPSMAAKFVKEMSEKFPFSKAEELCRSREDRSVPMLYIMEGERKKEERFGVWVQARQHAWESGSSWVAQGFGEWLMSDHADAVWLRQHAEIFLVPVMDVDNAASGNGGKDAEPHDHNRDWSTEPHWNEVKAAQRLVTSLIDENRLDVFLDLHNPGPDDPTFFYILATDQLPNSARVDLRDRFIDLTYGRISKIKPLIPMSNKPKETGPNYHPLWRQISANWAATHGNPHTVSLCLETIWNSPASTPTGYRAVGANLAATTREYLAERVK